MEKGDLFAIFHLPLVICHLQSVLLVRVNLPIN
jgi:hypothetical protein